MVMCRDRSSGGRDGLGVFGALGMVFVILKLVGVIDWSWWLVTLPFWGGLALLLVFLLIMLVIFLIMKI